MAQQGGLTFDDALTRYIGEFGRSQIKLFLVASLGWIPNCLLILLMVFQVSPNPITEKWWRCTDSSDVQCLLVFQKEDPSSDFCALPRSAWEWTATYRSIVSRFDLICGNSFKAQLVSAVFFFGYLIGSAVFGPLADTQGRRKGLFISIILGTVFTIITGLSSSYWMYFIFRMLTGIGAAGQALCTYIVATESVGSAWRGAAGIGTQIFFVLGEFVLVILAVIFKGWRALCFACAVLSGALLLTFPWMPESPRWLLVQGRKPEAEAIMKKMADVNGTRMPDQPLAQPPAEGPKVSLSSVLQDRHILRRFLVLAYVWLVLCMTYYGISLGVGGLKGMSVYTSFAVAAAAEIPANILSAYMIDKIGRHNTMSGGMVLATAGCLGCAFSPPGAAQAILAAVGKFGCAGAFNIASVFTGEMFPTQVRSAVLGSENVASRIGGISAPFIVLIGTSMGQPALPFIVFGVTSFVAAVAILTLPETLGTNLPDSMKDMENIASIFTTKPWRKGFRATTSEMFKTRAAKQKLEAVQEEERPLNTAADSAAYTNGSSTVTSNNQSSSSHRVPAEVALGSQDQSVAHVGHVAVDVVADGHTGK